MSWVLSLVLFAAGWLFIESGMEFFGAIAIIFGLIYLFISKTKAAQPAHGSRGSHAPIVPAPVGYPPAVIVRSGHASKFQQIKMRIHDPWDSAKGYEDTMNYAGMLFTWPLKILWRLMRIGKKK
ncbi:TPA: hypothetical protein HA244_03780 [Candidatus Micrarchaeota archaeon]|nr:hypothetical protein [Candidatus Micrarchaeota archaeon]